MCSALQAAKGFFYFFFTLEFTMYFIHWNTILSFSWGWEGRGVAAVMEPVHLPIGVPSPSLCQHCYYPRQGSNPYTYQSGFHLCLGGQHCRPPHCLPLHSMHMDNDYHIYNHTQFIISTTLISMARVVVGFAINIALMFCHNRWFDILSQSVGLVSLLL